MITTTINQSENVEENKHIETFKDIFISNLIKNNFDLNLCGKIQLIKSLNEDKYFIIDGLHRVMAIKSLGIKRLMKTNVQSEKLIEDTYMSNNPILVDKDTGV